ncbi:MAG: hypothetical protein CMJ31_05380 [Phycisphaerae bacterium]|nr:hypothetical protein [Phycisphaerae bacterium]
MARSPRRRVRTATPQPWPAGHLPSGNVALIIATLQFELLIHGAESLKDKRRVVKSVKDRLHREHLVSVAEVAALENPSLAVMGLAAVGADGKRLAQTLDRITEKLRGLHDAELGSTRRELIRGADDEDAMTSIDDAELAQTLAAEMAKRAEDTLS